ncbi:MAG: AmmeMemoRadiSam system radical SAM enzyme [Candidatus Omnitrophica bacterium]|jgi:pyruvate formate lyase activating enzyme|nr:AmmeMemoRadiSam system radical SAM enzyme [Candidatus Omnitrophota bacterium]
MKEALLYEKLKNKQAHCFLCSHQCNIPDQKFGFCGVRQNLDGTLYTHVYGKVIAANVDPIEKKPLYHFLPGSKSLSIAAIGCNFRCSFCQNWEISQVSLKDGSVPWGQEFAPEDIAASAIKQNCQSISYTYTEPTVFFEYALEIAKFARAKGLHNIFVTNGYMSAEAVRMLKPYLSAANVDLKFFNESSYRRFCGGSLDPVLDSIRLLRKSDIWVEVTTLVVPGSNDSPEELKSIAEFLAGVDKDIPWHISRFYPNYKFTSQDPTPEETLKLAMKLGYDAGLRYVYVGNVYSWGNDSLCPNCQKTLVKRKVYDIRENNIEKSKCKFCSHPIPGVFK